MIKVSDYIVKKLEEYGIRHVFMISGGGAMHLNDSFGKSQKIEYVCNHHEQASAIAAEGYSRASGELSVVCVTTGPGGINALNDVFGQWTDSAPVLYISGQVKCQTAMFSCPDINLRQLGDQEVDIVSIVKPIAKYAEVVKNPDDIGEILDKAIYLATHGRKGPVWVDVPIDVQSALIPSVIARRAESPTWQSENYFLGLLRHFAEMSSLRSLLLPHVPRNDIKAQVQKALEMLKTSKRPVIIAGHGIRLSNSVEKFLELIKKINIPVVSTLNGFDIIPSDNPNYIGRIGTIGDRAGNFTLQNADLIISLGSRNNIRQISYNYENFAHKAKKIIVDIDSAELEKRTLKPDLAICADVGEFLEIFSNYIDELLTTKYHQSHFRPLASHLKVSSIDNTLSIKSLHDYEEWLSWAKERRARYPVVLQEYKVKDRPVNPYFFTQTLTECMKDEDVLVAGNGTATVCLFQTAVIKNNQRFFCNSGNASMGYDLSAAIGAYFASGKDVICLAGDGSLMMNIQELQTVKHYNIPIKLFILNNDGYISIRQTQSNFFEGRFTACSEDSGVSMPDFVKVAEAFELPAVRIESQNNLERQILNILNTEGPIVCEVMLENDYQFTPKLSSEKLPDGRMISKPLEDMWPFLSREEFYKNII